MNSRGSTSQIRLLLTPQRAASMLFTTHSCTSCTFASRSCRLPAHLLSVSTNGVVYYSSSFTLTHEKPLKNAAMQLQLLSLYPGCPHYQSSFSFSLRPAFPCSQLTTDQITRVISLSTSPCSFMTLLIFPYILFDDWDSANTNVLQHNVPHRPFLSKQSSSVDSPVYRSPVSTWLTCSLTTNNNNNNRVTFPPLDTLSEQLYFLRLPRLDMSVTVST